MSSLKILYGCLYSFDFEIITNLNKFSDMRQKLFFLMLTLFMLGAASVQAQVTIGADAPPHSSAVLDLQSDNLGFKLPTIELDDVSVFQLSGTEDEADGIMIYNSSDATTGGSGKGIYVWEGEWIFVGKSAPVAVPVTKITILSTGDATAVNSGSNLQLTAIVEPAATASNQVLNWTIVYNPAMDAGSATIDQTGKITGGKPGPVTARAEATDGSGVYRNFAFSVNATDYVTGITVTSVNGSTSVAAGRYLQLQVEVEPVSALNSVIWSVDAESSAYASVDANGLVTAIAEGTATIQAASMDGSNTVGIINLPISAGAIVEPDNVLIGDNYYDTYNFNGTTWMIQNSLEGDWTYNMYNGDSNKMTGYYDYDHAASACPAGWKLPSVMQVSQLFAYLQGSSSLSTEKALWLSGPASGLYYQSTPASAPGWTQWDIYWRGWTAQPNIMWRINSYPNPSSWLTNEDFSQMTLGYTAVRCVKI
jgi:uncharacterized protein (TIGR02145 family)